MQRKGESSTAAVEYVSFFLCNDRSLKQELLPLFPMNTAHVLCAGVESFSSVPLRTIRTTTLPPPKRPTATATRWISWTCRVKRARRRRAQRHTARYRIPPLALMWADVSWNGIWGFSWVDSQFSVSSSLVFKTVQDNELDGSDLDSSNDEEEWSSDSSRYEAGRHFSK